MQSCRVFEVDGLAKGEQELKLSMQLMHVSGKAPGPVSALQYFVLVYGFEMFVNVQILCISNTKLKCHCPLPLPPLHLLPRHLLHHYLILDAKWASQSRFHRRFPAANRIVHRLHQQPLRSRT